jgi:type I restriction enzyme M protein
MNMFLHNEDNHRIEWGDTIRNPKLLANDTTLQRFDVVVANPPFSLDKWGHDDAQLDKFNRFSRGMPPKTKGDFAFILHMIESMKPGTGRMAVVVPHGLLFRGGTEKRIRRKLIEENLLDAVIGVPDKLFYGTGIPAAVLVFRKEKKDNKVLFIDASQEYQSGKNQNVLRPEDLERMLQTYAARQSVPGYAGLASPEDIAAREFNLNIVGFIDNSKAKSKLDMADLKKERAALKSEWDAIEAEIAGLIKGLGL